MTVDLSKLKAGDTVKFRCGGEAVVTHRSGLELYFDHEQWGNGIAYISDGRIGRRDDEGHFKNEKHAFDIISIVPKPFNWDDVEVGMAFRSVVGGEELWYVAEHPDDCYAIFCRNNQNKSLSGLCGATILMKGCAERFPEHDIEVQP